MQQVITLKQARQITGGRKPLVPVVYEAAIKALGECLSLDDAKVWDDKADALAAWAKIYQDDKAARQAKALKLHAYQRMGVLAAQLRPTVRKGFAKGNAVGPRSLLLELGMTKANAQAAVRLGRTAKEIVERLSSRPRIPGPQQAAKLVKGGMKNATEMEAFSMRSFIGRAAAIAEKLSPETEGKNLSPEGLRKLQRELDILVDWMERAASAHKKSCNARVPG